MTYLFVFYRFYRLLPITQFDTKPSSAPPGDRFISVDFVAIDIVYY